MHKWVFNLATIFRFWTEVVDRLSSFFFFLIISMVNIELLLINVGACQQELALEDTHRSIA